MIDGLPGYISPLFIATTFLTVGFWFYAIKSGPGDSLPGRFALFLTAFWLLFTAVLSLGGFYQVTRSFPPRIFAFGALPAIITGLVFLFFFRGSFVERLPLPVLTILHVIRIPVELVLYWLYGAGQIPEVMTFEGRNFDILSGLTAPIIYWLGFRAGKTNRTMLIIWNVAALFLLINIVSIAVMSFPSPLQRMAFERPNVAVMYFPFIWLPAVVVPIVFLSHTYALWNLIARRQS